MVECAVSVQRAFRKRTCLFIFCLKCSAALFFSLGYLPDGTPMNRAGNAINHPETIGPDPHTPGSPLPRALFCNSVGYLPDGTPMNAAGNALNHPETMQPDMHTPGSPLPPSHYYADVGYLVDGTDMATAGNLSVQALRHPKEVFLQWGNTSFIGYRIEASFLTPDDLRPCEQRQ